MDLPDDEKQGLGEWELDCAARLQSEYGVSYGKGWVRLTTEPGCPHHGAPD
jgi:hypothetical protein